MTVPDLARPTLRRSRDGGAVAAGDPPAEDSA